jgi:hypothetical protein
MAEGFKRIADMRMHLTVGGNGDRQRTRLRVGWLLYDIFNRMNSSLRNPNSELKMVQYSAVSLCSYILVAFDSSIFVTNIISCSQHDENVAAVLAALHQYNYTVSGPNFGVPEFAVCLLCFIRRSGIECHFIRFIFFSRVRPLSSLNCTRTGLFEYY